jgi:hypothetical protein
VENRYEEIRKGLKTTNFWVKKGFWDAAAKHLQDVKLFMDLLEVDGLTTPDRVVWSEEGHVLMSWEVPNSFEFPWPRVVRVFGVKDKYDLDVLAAEEKYTCGITVDNIVEVYKTLKKYQTPVFEEVSRLDSL